MSRARELARLGNANAISIDSSNNVGFGTTTSIQYKLDVVGDANFTGVLTATSFGGDGSNLTGVAATDNINTNNIKVSGISTLGTASATTLTATTSTVVGSAVTFNASGGTIVGVLTATSFEGDGSSLTGVAATDYIVSNSLKVLGISTFSGEVTAAGGVDVTGGVKSAGIVTFTNTTASTSSATGAVVITGGVGIGGSLHVGENVSVGGTLTYEDVTNIDVIGIITARAGVLVNGGRGIDIAAGGLEVTGVTTIGTGLSLTDNIKARFGASGDLSLYHNGSHSFIDEQGTGNLYIRSGTDNGITLNTDSDVILYFDNSLKFQTTTDGTKTTGIATATLGIDAAIAVWTLGASGTDHYTFTGPGNLSATSDPTLSLIRGQKYTFRNRSGGHPFRIQSTVNGSAGTAYNTGVTNNDGGNGTDILFDVPHNAPSVLYYQCTSHNNMGGAMYISGAGADNTFAGVVTATSFSGSGANLTNLPAAGISTAASTSAGIVSTLALSSAQDHKVTVSGVSTFTCNGGSEGDSHTLRITNSGITTIGFSTYFLFPSGSAPSIPTADGTVSLISFTVHRVGTPGIATQLLAGASLNFS